MRTLRRSGLAERWARTRRSDATVCALRSRSSLASLRTMSAAAAWVAAYEYDGGDTERTGGGGGNLMSASAKGSSVSTAE
jgi:hypothetical protein